MSWWVDAVDDFAFDHCVFQASAWTLRLTFSFARLDLSSVATTCALVSPAV